MKKTGIWPFYDRNKRSGKLEEESEYKKEGMERFPCFGAMVGLSNKDMSTKKALEKLKLDEHLANEEEISSERKKGWISVKRDENGMAKLQL